MFNLSLILWISVGLQFFAVYLALRLIPLTGRATAWVILSVAFLFMATRRTISLLYQEGLLTNQWMQALTTETVALTISVLLVTGIFLIKKIFIQQNEDAEEITKLSLAIEQSPSGTVILDTSGKIQYANAKYCEINNLSQQQLHGETPVFLNPQHTSITELNNIWSKIKNGNVWRGEFCNQDKKGNFHWDRAIISPLRNNLHSITHYIATLEDITTEKEQRETIQHIAMHDVLTNLPNRTLFNDRLSQAIINAKRESEELAVYLLDIQNFKEINNALGHLTGDVILREISRRLGMEINKKNGQVLARMGSDEFLIFSPDTGKDKANALAKKISQQLQQYFKVENRKIELIVNIGYTIYPQHCDTHEKLINCAEVAMYAAKENKCLIKEYEHTLDYGKLKRLELSSNFRQAAEQDQFILYYQPQINFKTKEITNVEALIRWLHPQHGMIPPDDFIELAEQSGHISLITDWVIKNSFLQLAIWHKDHHKIGLSINISAHDIQNKDILNTIEAELKRNNLDPTFITIEITEGSIMLYTNETAAALCKVSELGIQISVDDFGTGYSSLQYLKQMPVNEMKIDKSFVMHMTLNDNDAVIVRSTIDLAHNLGLKVVAEGIEDQDTADILEILGCDFGQGYHIAKPMSRDEFYNWLKNYKNQIKHYH